MQEKLRKNAALFRNEFRGFMGGYLLQHNRLCWVNYRMAEIAVCCQSVIVLVGEFHQIWGHCKTTRLGFSFCDRR